MAPGIILGPTEARAAPAPGMRPPCQGHGRRRARRCGLARDGDVATIDPSGYSAIVDRSKDRIKSGGERITSIALENAACGHPQVMQAAVIAAFHPKWQEQPLLIVTRKSGRQLDREALLAAT